VNGFILGTYAKSRNALLFHISDGILSGNAISNLVQLTRLLIPEGFIFASILILSVVEQKKPTETVVGVGWEDYFLAKVLLQLLDQSFL